jgi:ATP-dependent Lon protease
LEVLDPEQNTTFHDNYLDAEYDLSKVLFIATANDIGAINPALRDRMEMINIPGYILEDKIHIASEHLVKKQCEAHGLRESEMILTTEILEKIISDYTRESGVRSLDKQIAKLSRARAKQIAFNEAFAPELSAKDIEKILGKAKFRNDEYEIAGMVGVVTGLAWTAVGGDILYIESVLTPGKGALSLTGNLGDVMKESATIAYEWVQAHHEELGIAAELFEKKNLNIHVPEGAIPKDGPSAGITMATAILSVFTGRKVRTDVAMTGEITLRGKVLPIGGLKEKAMAAVRAGIFTIIIPKGNERDIQDIPAEIAKKMRFVLVENVREVFEVAIEK